MASVDGGGDHDCTFSALLSHNYGVKYDRDEADAEGGREDNRLQKRVKETAEPDVNIVSDEPDLDNVIVGTNNI